MKKFKKFVSVLCAISMILSLSVSAFAAEPATGDISPNAGKTIDVQAIVFRADGTTEEKVVYVDIPADATVEMENEITSTAAREAVGISGCTYSARATSFDQTLGSDTCTLEVANPSATTRVSVGSGTLEADCAYLEVKFTSVDSGIKKINVRMENTYWTVGSPNLNCFETFRVVAVGHTCTATFYEGQVYPESNPTATCRLWKGDFVKVYASVNEGTSGDVTYSTGVYFS